MNKIKRIPRVDFFAPTSEQAGLSGMTVTGNVGGTPAYMPREQVINFRQVKPVTDVWSLGATFYCMLTGQLPRDFPRRVDPMEVALGGRIVPIRERDAGIPTKLAEVIDRSLAVNPKDRWQDAAQMHHDGVRKGKMMRGKIMAEGSSASPSHDFTFHHFTMQGSARVLPLTF